MLRHGSVSRSGLSRQETEQPPLRSLLLLYAIAKCLGVKGGKNRAKLPPMRPEAHRRALYPDATGVATKVGYKRARDGEEPPSPPDLSGLCGPLVKYAIWAVRPLLRRGPSPM